MVNSASWASRTVANHFIELRQIPPTNVVMVDWTRGFESVDGDNLREKIIGPALDAIDKRGLRTQIDYIVYSSDFPYSVNLEKDYAGVKFPEQIKTAASITSATYAWALLFNRSPYLVDPHINRYMRAAAGRETDDASHGFRSWYGWERAASCWKPADRPSSSRRCWP